MELKRYVGGRIYGSEAHGQLQWRGLIREVVVEGDGVHFRGTEVEMPIEIGGGMSPLWAMEHQPFDISCPAQKVAQGFWYLPYIGDFLVEPNAWPATRKSRWTIGIISGALLCKAFWDRNSGLDQFDQWLISHIGSFSTLLIYFGAMVALLVLTIWNLRQQK